MPPRHNRTELPIFPAQESPCANCWGACCRQGMIIPLTSQEAALMREHGADLWQPPIRNPRPAADESERSYYALQQDCPFLSEADGGAAFCTVYDDPQKPEACTTFEVGSRACQRAQATVVRAPLSDEDFMM